VNLAGATIDTLRPIPHNHRRGFTLFEVVLAVAISAVLVGLLTMSVHIYLQTVSTGRNQVEQTQLARAILGRMADDLRAAFRFAEQDVSSVEALASATADFDPSSLDSGGGGGTGTTGTAGTAGAATSIGGDDTTSDDLASTALVPPTPGVYGTQYELQVDIARIPRFDELDALMLQDTVAPSYASDLRTVTYYLQKGTEVEGSPVAATRLSQDTLTTAGLMRRELDRVTSTYAFEFGNTQILQDKATVLAPEVTWVEFRYFDGTEYWLDWDSSLRGAPPMAVEINIWLRQEFLTEEEQQRQRVAYTADGPGPFDQHYHLLVRLPSGEPTSATDAASMGGTTSESSSGSTSGSSGGASGASGGGAGGGAGGGRG